MRRVLRVRAGAAFPLIVWRGIQDGEMGVGWGCQAWSGAASVTPARDEAQHIVKEVLGVNRRNNNPV